LPTFTEEQNSGRSGVYSDVQWRSVAEVIKYLGTILRTADPTPGDRWQESDDDGRAVTHVLFDLSRGRTPGFSTIEYRGSPYTIHSVADSSNPDVRDHSMEALSLLNELVSVAKVSSDIPNSQSIQIVP
jgi:hypothetical protein